MWEITLISFAIFERYRRSHLQTSKTPYGHFAVLKALAYCTDPSQQRKIAAALSGRFVSLACHSIGARVVESALALLPAKVSLPLKAEFYGKVQHLPLFHVCARCAHDFPLL